MNNPEGGCGGCKNKTRDKKEENILNLVQSSTIFEGFYKQKFVKS